MSCVTIFQKKSTICLCDIVSCVSFLKILSHMSRAWRHTIGRKRPYDRTTVRPYKLLLLTYVVNCTAGTPTARLCSVVQWSVHWAPSRTNRVLVLAGARRCALETCGKKIRAPLLGLVKSIYYFFAKFELTTCSLY